MHLDRVRTLHIQASTHGRVLVEDAADALSPAGRLVLFHGYAQSAEQMLENVRTIPGASSWTLVSVQALNRFYNRDSTRTIASWMTRQDRELAIADNVAYVDKAIGSSGHRVIGSSDHRTVGAPDRLVFVGFSQGASMAYRAAALGRHPAAGIIALGGDIPPELKNVAASSRDWPPVLIGAGRNDTWFIEKADADERFLRSRGVDLEVARFDGGHEWTDEFRAAAGRWLARIR